jgi:hypothetical protein
MSTTTKTYDCYVRLAHVSRGNRLMPAAGAYKADDPENCPNGWQDLVTDGTLAIWAVERTMVSHAKDLVLAHLAGHAPVGVKKLYDRDQTHQTRQSGIEPVSNMGREDKYLTRSGVVDINDL